MGRHTDPQTGLVSQTAEFIAPSPEVIAASQALDFGDNHPPLLPFTAEANSGGDFPLVNRVEVIDESGRAFTAYYKPAGVYWQLQDKETTLKIFAGTPVSADESGHYNR